MSKTRSFAGSSVCSASAEDVWAVWTDPAKWPGDVIKQATIDGPFVVGARITTQVKGYPALTSTVTRIEPSQSWVGVARSLGLTFTIDHIIEATDSGTLLTESAVLSGPLAPLASRMMGTRLESTYRKTTAYCARLAEARTVGGG